MTKKVANIVKEFDIMNEKFLLLKIGIAFLAIYHIGYGVGKFVFYVLH